ncbi:GNAT family N-acetyltransferase [Labrenzia sp. R4_1]|uniref:GNAT family N-acetyltransferase n=1 Tax=Labrenzia sp. R4_1 TaxID=2821106 RepID=UPI001ADA2A8A|nr:GNAT family N-acetyltransferase [Labrenzia sp. R4_1]MBO9423774.1 GNAT family N-acetyltransferase [Labrenzia sp. R4_1]
MSRTWQVVLGSPVNRRDILGIVRTCREETGRNFNKQYESAISRFLVDASAGRIYLIDVRGVPAGYASVSFQQSVTWGGQLAVLEELQLLKAYEGQGLAQRVLRAIIGDLENFGPDVVVAYVNEDDPLAAVYEIEGFSRTALIRYSDQESDETC